MGTGIWVPSSAFPSLNPPPPPASISGDRILCILSPNRWILDVAKKWAVGTQIGGFSAPKTEGRQGIVQASQKLPGCFGKALCFFIELGLRVVDGFLYAIQCVVIALH